MAHDIEAVTFSNRDGLKLFGTLHTPRFVNSSLPLIVLLSAGIKMRVGPHRLYNRMTSHFNELGFSVFKFDYVGLGDSEGELDRALLTQVYNDIEKGRFVNDSVDALNWIAHEQHFTSFILGGLCGGAITALLTAQIDIRAVGVLSLGMTTTLSMGDTARTEYASQGELAALRKSYLKRALDIKSWLRLLSFQSDFKAIAKSFGQAFAHNKPSFAGPRALESIKPTNANSLFPPAFFDVTLSERPILLIFGESDRTYWDFDEKFAVPYAAQLAQVKQHFELHVVKEANHVFSFREWEDDMLLAATAWLTSRFLHTPQPSGK